MNHNKGKAYPKRRKRKFPKDEAHKNWTVDLLLLTPLGAVCGLVFKNNIPPLVCGTTDIGMCERKEFRFSICGKMRFLSRAVVFQPASPSSWGTRFIGDMKINDVILFTMVPNKQF